MRENEIKKDKEVVLDKKQNERKKNKTKIILIILFIVIILAVIAFFISNYYGSEKKESEPIKTEKEEVYSEYRMSGNSLEPFDLAFLQLENGEKNKIYSPLSIKYALEMLGEGSKGASKAQIDSVIGDYKAKKYTNNSNMSFANAMFIRDTYKDNVKDNYIKRLNEKYNAEIIYDSFATADNANAWVSNKTFGLIDNLFDDISDKQFLLINALAIDMEWNKLIQATTNNGYKDVFSVSYAHEKFGMYISPIEGEHYSSVKFNNNTINAKAVEIGAAINKYDIVNTLGEDKIRETVGNAYKEWLVSGETCGGDNLEVDAFLDKYIEALDSNYQSIKSSTDFSFYVDEEVKAFAKDLKEYNGTTLQYVGIMPKNNNLSEYVKNINPSTVNNIINNLKTIELENFEEGKVTKITGYIPLFKFEYELDLMADLKKLGITDVFDDSKADLSSMVSSKGTYIDSASHKANIEFSNEGIKAAAATQFGGLGAASCGFEYLYDVPVETIDLTFDNPYLFLIRDKNTGEVWFTGTVYEPIENN